MPSFTLNERIKGLSQDQTSFLCGYARATIGHIENGRIELDRERINYIVEAYGYKYSDFTQNMGKTQLRDNVVNQCVEIIKLLDDGKLEIVKNLLGSF